MTYRQPYSATHNTALPVAQDRQSAPLNPADKKPKDDPADAPESGDKLPDKP
ncbi:hypothetical protein ACL2XP_02355 [Sodalis sp. RH21]|uniref:hypothetical protein n=1 Tax=unclassified Sodalis (in: enterobacteria) TaxID=2636512 RepID=UPI0039B4C877